MPLRIPLLVLLALLGALAPLHAQFTAGEYFFDTDPGPGQGFPLSMAAGDTVDLMSAIPLPPLTPGRHTLSVRFQSATGSWSAATTRAFVVQPSSAGTDTEFIAAECFADTDPDPGNGTSLPIAPGDSVSIIATLPAPSSIPGMHRLSLRFQTLDGSWTQSGTRTFFIEPPRPPAATRITAAVCDLHGDLLTGETFDSTFALTPVDGTLDSTIEATFAELLTDYLPGPRTLPRGSYTLTAHYTDDRANTFSRSADFEVTSGLVIVPAYPGPGNIFLRWHRSPRDDGAWAVYRGSTLNGIYTFVDSTTANFYVDDLAASFTALRFYRVTARYLGASLRIDGNTITPLDPAYREE